MHFGTSGEDDILQFKASIRMCKRGDLNNCNKKKKTSKESNRKSIISISFALELNLNVTFQFLWSQHGLELQTSTMFHIINNSYIMMVAGSLLHINYRLE